MNDINRQRLQRKRQRIVMFLRLKNWIISMPRKPWLILPIIAFAFAVVLLWRIQERYLVIAYSNPILKYTFQYGLSVIFFAIAVVLLMALLMVLSRPWVAKHCEDALLMIGLTAHDGMPPALVGHTRLKRTKAYQYTFYSLGISSAVWKERKSEIEDALNVRIIGEILYGNSRNIIVLTVVRGVGDRMAGVLYDDEL